MKRMILASASPRRHEILRRAGLRFTVDAAEFEEDLGMHLPPRELARVLSGQKAEAVALRNRNAIVVAADTLIAFQEKVLGKPHTAAEAKRMLRLLSGKAHTVITGFTVIDTETGRRASRSVATKVYFRRLDHGRIEEYVRSGEPLDKAGAYAIQGLGAAFVRRIEGDYLNVVGLPYAALAKVLREFGVPVPRISRPGSGPCSGPGRSGRYQRVPAR